MERWLITGIGRGIAREMTRQLLERGDAVVGTVRTEAAAQQLKRAFPGAAGQRLQVLLMDIRDRESIARVARAVAGPLDVVVNSAAVLGPDRQSALDTDFDGFLDTLVVNTLGPLAVMQAFVPHVRGSARPRIVCITSKMGSFTAYTKGDLVVYQASKAAANKLVRAMAIALEPQGIIVLAAHPGLVRTEMSGERATGSPNSISAPESAAGLLKVIDGLAAADNGRFLDYSGAELGW
jgi:NAD(P)-dependent dehydrogenase (short-subunit alcohol dehydrogenase family)